jgi:2,3-bisphosphoglycerate-dependent phosphoglycerate mutase/probable phosphoglycerate mutase
VANRERRYQGRGDSPLTAYGEAQGLALAERLRRIPFNVALISPTERTRLLADTLLSCRENVLREEHAGWAETNHGHWEGLTYREVLERFPGEAEARWAQGIHGRAQGGESLAETAERIANAYRELLQRFPGGRVLVVTHATPIQLVICHTFKLPPSEHWHWRIDLGSVTCLDVYPSGAIVRMVNEVPPLVTR